MITILVKIADTGFTLIRHKVGLSPNNHTWDVLSNHSTQPVEADDKLIPRLPLVTQMCLTTLNLIKKLLIIYPIVSLKCNLCTIIK